MPIVVRRLATTWLIVTFALIAVLLSRLAFRDGSLTEILLVKQDLIVLAGLVVTAVICALESTAVAQMGALINEVAGRAAVWVKIPGRPLILALCLAVLCGFFAWAGTWFVFDGYALTRDEDMANFGAAMLAHGKLVARIPVGWRAFAHSLQSYYLTFTPGDAFWLPPYLPMYSALRALAGLTGSQSLVNPVLAGVSVFAVFAVARRLWPGRDDLALVAAILLATSSQVLIAGMSSYAMTSYMAFNLVWLWLFLRGGWPAHLGALLVGFLASGLHQLAFHPLFAAPFILQLLVERRWRLATLYTVAYSAICLFWAEYGRMAFATIHEATSSGSGTLSVGYAERILLLLRQFGPRAYLFMDENFVRFVTWQNLLATPLAVIGFVGAFKAKGTLRSLALGLVLTTAVVFLVTPEQGQGWGYRYWHGLLGSICLIAAFAWGRLTEALAAPEKGAAGALFAVCAAASILALFPLRAWQAHAYVHPYAAAYASIQRAGTQVVLVDPAGAWLTIELVRNDPFLRNRPLEFDLSNLTKVQVADLCSRYTVSVFGPADATGFGISRLSGVVYPGKPYIPISALVRSSCGIPRTPVREIIPG